MHYIHNAIGNRNCEGAEMALLSALCFLLLEQFSPLLRVQALERLLCSTDCEGPFFRCELTGPCLSPSELISVLDSRGGKVSIYSAVSKMACFVSTEKGRGGGGLS